MKSPTATTKKSPRKARSVKKDSPSPLQSFEQLAAILKNKEITAKTKEKFQKLERQFKKIAPDSSLSKELNNLQKELEDNEEVLFRKEVEKYIAEYDEWKEELGVNQNRFVSTQADKINTPAEDSHVSMPDQHSPHPTNNYADLIKYYANLSEYYKKLQAHTVSDVQNQLKPPAPNPVYYDIDNCKNYETLQKRLFSIQNEINKAARLLTQNSSVDFNSAFDDQINQIKNRIDYFGKLNRYVNYSRDFNLLNQELDTLLKNVFEFFNSKQNLPHTVSSTSNIDYPKEYSILLKRVNLIQNEIDQKLSNYVDFKADCNHRLNYIKDRLNDFGAFQKNGQETITSLNQELDFLQKSLERFKLPPIHFKIMEIPDNQLTMEEINKAVEDLFRKLSAENEIKFKNLNSKSEIKSTLNQFVSEEKKVPEVKAELVKPISQLNSDLIDAGYRIAATQVSKLSRTAVVNALNVIGADNSSIEAVKSLLQTEYGFALLSMLLGMGITYLPQFQNSPRALKLAEECRIQSITTAGNELFSDLLSSLGPALLEAVNSIPEEDKSETLNSENDKSEQVSTPQLETAELEKTGHANSRVV